MINVEKRSGNFEPLDITKVERALVWAQSGLSVDYREIFNENSYAEYFYDGVQTNKIQNLLANKAETKGSENWDWSYFAARLSLQKVLKEAHGSYPYKSETEYYLDFYTYLCRVENEGVKKLQHERLLNHFDIEKINAAIVPERDLNFEFMGITTIADRYLLKNAKDEIIEAPQHYFMRVAMGLALAEDKEIATEKAIELYNSYSLFTFMSSTPTLFNSATTKPQLSSCYVLCTQGDSLEGIYDTAKEIAQCSKFSGGTANSMTVIRGKGSRINSTGGKSSGVIPYSKLYEQSVRSFDQGGKRPGVVALYLETWHIDIFDFLNSINPGGDERESVRDINLATWNSDLFMNRVLNDQMWTLMSPDQCPDLHDKYGQEFEDAYVAYENNPNILKRVVKARDVWKAVLKCLFNNKGNGWPCFKDTINRRSMTRGYGVVHSSNLCTEITLRNGYMKGEHNDELQRTSVCNLGSVNLSKVKTKRDLETAVRIGVRAIDNAITEGYIPIKSGKLFNDEDRPLGLGVMGYSELLAELGIPYDSIEHAYAADILFEYISYIAIDESSKLGEQKGNFPMFEKSQWSKGELPIDTGYSEKLQSILDSIEYRHEFFENLKQDIDWESLRLRSSKNMRNSTLLAIAPTASISNIVGCISCTEVPQENIYQKKNLSGSFVVVSPLYRKYHKTNPKVVCDAKTSSHYHAIVAAAARQKWIDQAQSYNSWVTENISGKELSDMYILTWELNLKTNYYLRSEAPQVKAVEAEHVGSIHSYEAFNTHDAIAATEQNRRETDIPENIESLPMCSMEEGCVVCQ